MKEINELRGELKLKKIRLEIKLLDWNIFPFKESIWWTELEKHVTYWFLVFKLDLIYY